MSTKVPKSLSFVILVSSYIRFLETFDYKPKMELRIVPNTKSSGNSNTSGKFCILL